MSFQRMENLRPEEYRERWTKAIKQQQALLEATDSSALVFRLGTEFLALPTSAVQEVIERRQVHSIPRRRNGILLGLANCRGELTICISLSALLRIAGSGEQPAAPGKIQLMAVLNWRGSRLGFPVDEVLHTFRFQRAALLPPPPALQTGAGYTLGLLECEGRLVTFLDADLVLAGVNQNLV